MRLLIGNRGRNGALSCTAPPSEPDGRISRIRLSGQWSYHKVGCHAEAWAAARENSPRSAKKVFGQR